MNTLTRFNAIVLTLIAAVIATLLLQTRITTMKVTTKHHILRSPLIVYSGWPHGQVGVLPVGTSLRYVESFPEGFDRFIVFVNVERSPLPLEEMTPRGLVDPLSASPAGNAGTEQA